MAAIGSPTASVDDVPRFAVGNPKAPRNRISAMSLARSNPMTSTSYGPAVGQADRGDLGGALDDVVVGQHLAVRIDQDAGAGTGALVAECGVDVDQTRNHLTQQSRLIQRAPGGAGGERRSPGRRPCRQRLPESPSRRANGGPNARGARMPGIHVSIVPEKWDKKPPRFIADGADVRVAVARASRLRGAMLVGVHGGVQQSGRFAVARGSSQGGTRSPVHRGRGRPTATVGRIGGVHGDDSQARSARLLLAVALLCSLVLGSPSLSCTASTICAGSPGSFR